MSLAPYLTKAVPVKLQKAFSTAQVVHVSVGVGDAVAVEVGSGVAVAVGGSVLVAVGVAEGILALSKI